METIKIREVYYDPLSLYQKVNTKSISQRALLGYMNRNGYLRDPIYGGAFSLLRDFESHAGIPIIVQMTHNDKVAKEIYEIANNAMLGRYNSFALPVTFIRETKLKLQKGGK